jgi:predicted DNA-binding transcriptional regulator AlpA
LHKQQELLMRNTAALLKSTAAAAQGDVIDTLPGSPRKHRIEKDDSDDPLIGTAAVAAELMCHPVSVYRYMRERPDFPVPIRISANRLAWRLSTIRAYVASRPLRERKPAVA